MIRYFAELGTGKMILWCYLWWYLVTVAFHFDPSVRIWANSLGISLVVGIALMLSVTGAAKRSCEPPSPAGQPRPADTRRGPDPWQTFRLFLMPFCVSSFSSLIKGQEFLLIIPPRPVELLTAVTACAAFVLFVCLVKWNRPHTDA